MTAAVELYRPHLPARRPEAPPAENDHRYVAHQASGGYITPAARLVLLWGHAWVAALGLLLAAIAGASAAMGVVTALLAACTWTMGIALTGLRRGRR